MEYCNHCGAKIVKYWHRLNKPLCAAMIRIYKKAGLRAVKISDLLTHNQVCNFQKLKYWGLVDKLSDNEGKGGTWKLTPTAERFIKGELALPIRVQTFRGKVEEVDEEKILISKIIEGYQYRYEYVEGAE